MYVLFFANQDDEGKWHVEKFLRFWRTKAV